MRDVKMSRFPIETVFEEFYKRVSGEMKCPSGNRCFHLAPRRQQHKHHKQTYVTQLHKAIDLCIFFKIHFKGFPLLTK